jgi:hypothetical protein
MINYSETKTYRVLLNYDWQISEQFLWSLFVVAFKAKTEDEFADGMISVIDDLDTDEEFKESLAKALVSDLEDRLK